MERMALFGVLAGMIWNRELQPVPLAVWQAAFGLTKILDSFGILWPFPGIPASTERDLRSGAGRSSQGFDVIASFDTPISETPIFNTHFQPRKVTGRRRSSSWADLARDLALQVAATCYLQLTCPKSRQISKGIGSTRIDPPPTSVKRRYWRFAHPPRDPGSWLAACPGPGNRERQMLRNRSKLSLVREDRSRGVGGFWYAGNSEGWSRAPPSQCTSRGQKRL